MRAAIYARKSKEQHVADEAKSTSRQIAGARSWIASRGWTDTATYEDDGISGALFANRAEFQRMMRDASAGVFDAIVLFDLDRFGRQASKTMTALNTLTDLGIAIWDYSTGQQIEIESFEGEISTYLKARFAQQQREQSRKHTRDSMRAKFLRGEVVGGRTFGYNNVQIAPGRKVRQIDETEAAIVREIYQRYAKGQGGRTIAHTLNARQVPCPRAQRGRPSGWDPGTIRAILDRSIYRGVETYGKTKKAYARELPKHRAHRERGQIRTSSDAWMTREAPELRIIDADLARQVDAQRSRRATNYLRSANGRVLTHRSGCHTSKYLLSGLLKCPCGASFEALKTGTWTKHGPIYICAARRRKGPKVCRYDLKFPIAETDLMFLDTIDGDVLAPAFIEDVLDSAYQARTTVREVEDERARLTQEIEHLTAAIAASGPLPSLVSAITDRERRVQALVVPRELPDREALRRALTQQTQAWRETLRKHPAQGRLVLQALIGPIVVEGERPEWVATPRPEALLSQVQHVASPTGFEPVFQP